MNNPEGKCPFAHMQKQATKCPYPEMVKQKVETTGWGAHGLPNGAPTEVPSERVEVVLSTPHVSS